MVEAELIDQQPSCFLVSLRVRESDADLCAEKLRAMNLAMSRTEGFSSLDVIRREGGLGTDFYVLARFQTAGHLDRWMASPDRGTLLAEVEALAITDISRQRMSGSNIWFEPVVSIPSTPKPPLFWKRWATSMLAVYPALIVLFYALRPITAQLPIPLGLLLVAFVLTGLSTAFIVPWLTRALHKWLIAR